MKLNKNKIAIFIVTIFFVIAFNSASSKIFGDVGKAFEKATGINVPDTPTVFQKPLDKLNKKGKKSVNELGKAKKKLAKEWNHFREEKVDPIGDAIALIYYSIKDGRKEFPSGFGIMKPRRISNPDVTASIGSDFFNDVLKKLTEKSIPLDKDNPNSNNYFNLSGADITLDENRQVLIFKGSGGMLGLEAFDSKLRGGVRVNGFTLEIFVNSEKINGEIFANIDAKLTYLDLNDTPPLVERSIAHGIHREIFNKDSVARLNITNLIKAQIPYINRDEKFSFIMSDAALHLVNNSVAIEILMKK